MWSVGSNAAGTRSTGSGAAAGAEEEWAYLWADGIYSGLRGERERLYVLVVIGVNARGEKHFVAIEDGVRESTQSWREVLQGMKQRGFTRPAKLAVGDGALGFWAALSEVFPTTRTQRCWMHKTGNVLNHLPKSGQAKAKQGLHGIWMAETRAQAERAFDDWLERYDDKYPKATACLARDRDELLAFYDFPAAHWTHLRTTNVIESAFATIRHRGQLASQGLRHPTDHVVNDLQDGQVRGEILTPAPRLPPTRQRHRGHQSRRMTNPPYTKFDNSSSSQVRVGKPLVPARTPDLVRRYQRSPSPCR